MQRNPAQLIAVARALAPAQVERCKAVIRDAVKAIEEGGGLRAIPADAFDSDGGVGEKHIFCAACEIDESTEVLPPFPPALLSSPVFPESGK